MTNPLDEAQVGTTTAACFRELGYDYLYGPDIGPDGERVEGPIMARWFFWAADGMPCCRKS